MVTYMEPTRVMADAEKCFACLSCQLRCSLLLEGTFNPTKAAIKIKRSNGLIEIRFTDSCKDCGACAKYCAYGALTLLKEAEEI